VYSFEVKALSSEPSESNASEICAAVWLSSLAVHSRDHSSPKEGIAHA